MDFKLLILLALSLVAVVMGDMLNGKAGLELKWVLESRLAKKSRDKVKTSWVLFSFVCWVKLE
jgi:hypothetical protein